MMQFKRNLPNLLTNLFFIWVLVHFGMGGWRNGFLLLQMFGFFGWVVLAGIVVLIVYSGDYRIDLSLFAAGVLLGYWGEWWGTTRGVWTYWNGAMPPHYLPPLWGIGLITVHRISRVLGGAWKQPPGPRLRRLVKVSMLVVPLLGLAFSWQRLAGVDWRGRLDAHFIAGIIVAAVLIAYRFDARRSCTVFLCGTLLGGFYEAMGTLWGEWTYITAETPPIWIAPLWGLACTAMVGLGSLLRQAVENSLLTLRSLWRASAIAGGD